MLVRFSVENCLSFRDRVELSMIASEEVRDHPEHVIRAGGQEGIPVLKLGVMYGANASGKSNLVKAMLMARDLILYPQGVRRRIVRAPFKLDLACRDAPTRFEFEIKLVDRCFAYGFSVSAERVEEEWLFEVGRTVEDRIFERKDGVFEWGERLGLSSGVGKDFLEITARGTPATHLFLTDCRERNLHKAVPGVGVLLDVLRWFEEELLIALPDWVSENIASRAYSDESFRRQLTHYLRSFDTGIERIDIEDVEPPPSEFGRQFLKNFEFFAEPPISDGYSGSHTGPYEFWARDAEGALRGRKLVSQHRRGDESSPGATFEMSEESDGTRRLMQLVPAMIAMMEGGGVFVIDELDRSLHADILHSYLANFLKYSVGRSSQLIVTTHDTTLLRQDFLRRDEVWFVEKGKDQSSRLVALEEYKDVDQSKDLQQDYLLGRFGGVPVIRDFSWLGEKHGETA